jgi:hypothetical protein
MKRRLDFDRVFVTDAPVPVYTATMPCTVTAWVISDDHLEQDTEHKLTRCYLQVNDPASLSITMGVPMSFDHPTDVVLAAGETLYAVTTDMAYLGYHAMSEE